MNGSIMPSTESVDCGGLLGVVGSVHPAYSDLGNLTMRRLLDDEQTQLFEPVRLLVGAAIAVIGYLVGVSTII